MYSFWVTLLLAVLEALIAMAEKGEAGELGGRRWREARGNSPATAVGKGEAGRYRQEGQAGEMCVAISLCVPSQVGHSFTS